MAEVVPSQQDWYAAQIAQKVDQAADQIVRAVLHIKKALPVRKVGDYLLVPVEQEPVKWTPEYRKMVSDTQKGLLEARLGIKKKKEE